MGVRRVKSWARLSERAGYGYSNLPDDDLLAMKKIARAESAMFLTEGSGTFVAMVNRSGLYAINLEVWKRGLTPAQKGQR